MQVVNLAENEGMYEHDFRWCSAMIFSQQKEHNLYKINLREGPQMCQKL